MTAPTNNRRRAQKRSTTVNTFRVVGGSLALAYVAVLLYPLVGTLVSLFADPGPVETLSNAFGARGVGSAMRNSVIILITAVPISLATASLFAWLNERTDATLGWVSDILPLAPYLLPPVALATGWVFLASEDAGYLNTLIVWVAGLVGFEIASPLQIGTWWGLIFVYVLHLIPSAYLVISAAMRNVDGSQDEASRMSGAGVLRTLRRVTLPGVIPAIAAAALLNVVIAFALFSIPSIIGARAGVTVLPVHIYRLVRAEFPPRMDEAVVLGGVIVLVVGAVWYLQRRVTLRGRHATVGGKGARVSRVKLGVLKWPARALMIAYLMATAVLPIAALLIVSLQPYWSPTIDLSQLSLENFRKLLSGSSPAMTALLNSGGLGVIGATLGILAAAILVIYARLRGGRIAGAIDGATKLPGTISHMVIAVAFVVTLSGAPFYLQGTIFLLLLAYIVIYMPQASITAGSASNQIGPEMLEASTMSGASESRTVTKVLLPLMTPGLAAGWALLFVVMIGDLTASALLAGTSNPVVGFVILNIWETGTYSTLAALALLVSLVSTICVGTVLLLSKRRSRRGV